MTTAEELAGELWALEVETTRVVRDAGSLAGRQAAIGRLLSRARASSEPELALRSMERRIRSDRLDRQPWRGVS